MNLLFEDINNVGISCVNRQRDRGPRNWMHEIGYDREKISSMAESRVRVQSNSLPGPLKH